MCRQRECGGGRPSHPAGPPGVVLVITLLLVGLMTVMTTTMINLSSSDYLVATNESRSIQALFNADAGTEEAKMRVSPNAPPSVTIPIGTSPNWRAYILSGTTQAAVQGSLDPTYGKTAPNYTSSESTSNYFFYNTVQTGSNAIQWGWARIEHQIDNAGSIVYQDALTGQATTVASQVVGGNTVYNPPMLVVTAEGIQGSVRRMVSPNFRPIVSTTTSNTDVVTDPFKNAIHARNTVELVGNAWTDSFDSRNGPYHPINNKGHKGHVSTDGIAAGIITVETNSTVDGDAVVGPGGNVAVAINNSGTITGSQGTEPGAQNLPLSSIPAGLINQGPLTIAGNREVVLSEGTYWFFSISITGNGRLRTTGAVKIYVTGNIDVGGNGIATAGNLPPNLLIYGTQDPSDSSQKTTTVKIHGNGDFYGAVYAPGAALDVYGNGAVYGALTGNTAKVNGNGGFHYDESLGNLGRFVTTTVSTTYTTTGFSRHSWREVTF
ncbi:MAG TPA: PilX N-terminal domain-containing pilus assembly protein [Candidatus Methylomirabilis sp.]